MYLQTTLNILILTVEHIVLDHVFLEPWQQVHEGERAQHLGDLSVRICRINNHGANMDMFWQGGTQWGSVGGREISGWQHFQVTYMTLYIASVGSMRNSQVYSSNASSLLFSGGF